MAGGLAAHGVRHAPRRQRQARAAPPQVPRFPRPRRDHEPRHQRHRQHQLDAAAEHDAADHLGLHHPRRRRHDAVHQSDAHRHRDRDPARCPSSAPRRSPAHSQKHFVAQQRVLGELNGHIEEMYTGHKVVKAFRHEARSVQEFREINDRLYRAAWRAQFVSGLIFPDDAVREQHRLRDRLRHGRHIRHEEADRARRRAGVPPVLAAVHAADHPDREHRQHPAIHDRIGGAGLRAPRRDRGGPRGPGREGHRFAPGRGQVRPRQVRLLAGRPAHGGHEHRRRAGANDCDRRAHRGGQDHAGEPPDAVLRDRLRQDHGGRHRHPRPAARQPAHDVRHGPPGHLALQRDHQGEHRLRQGGSHATRRSCGRPGPPTRTTLSGPCRRATVRC